MNVEIKYRIKQYKGDINMYGSPILGYVHEEIVSHSFYYVQQNEEIAACNTFVASSSSLS